MANDFLNFSLDTSTQKEFDKTFAEYIKWNNRQPAEIVNGKLYFVALNAMRTTKMADRTTIRQKLLAPSRDYPDIPLASVIVNSQLAKKQKKGLYGKKMAEAMEKLIKKQQSRIQFLRSGWIPALKILDFWNKRNIDNLRFTRRFAPKRPEGIKQYGREKGTAVFAKQDRTRVWGSITNLVGQGKQASPTVQKILAEGLNKAVMAETRSMRIYIDRKFREQFDKMRRTGRV